MCNVGRMANVPRIRKGCRLIQNPGIVTVQDRSLRIFVYAWSSFRRLLYCFLVFRAPKEIQLCAPGTHTYTIPPTTKLDIEKLFTKALEK